MLVAAGLRIPALAVLLASTGCTSFTSMHGGYGVTPRSERSVAGLELRRAAGSKLDSAHVLFGARIDGGNERVDLEAHAGLMRPVHLAAPLTLVPSATLELARVTNDDGNWSGGALGPGLGTELIWWLETEVRPYQAPNLFGCMGGVVGADCPRGCFIEEITRTGVGLRGAAEYDMRLTPSFPAMNDLIVWLTVGVTLANSPREHERCYFDSDAPLPENGVFAP